MNFVESPVFPWLLTLLMSCIAIPPPSPPPFNPCHDTHAMSPQMQVSQQSRVKDQGGFLNKILNDLTKTIEITDEIIRQLDEDIQNTDHISALRGRGQIETLIWEPLEGLPFETQLLNIYRSLRRVDIFSRHIRQILTSTHTHSSLKSLIYTMLAQLGQGTGSGGGLYQIMCDIYGTIEIVEPVVVYSGLIPESFQGEKYLAEIHDDFYHVLMNTQRLLNQLTGHMQDILRVQT